MHTSVRDRMHNSCVKTVSPCQDGAVDVLALLRTRKDTQVCDSLSLRLLPVDGCQCLASVCEGLSLPWFTVPCCKC